MFMRRFASSAPAKTRVAARRISRACHVEQFVAIGSVCLTMATVLSIVHGVSSDRVNALSKPGRTVWLDRIRITSMASWLTTRFGISCWYQAGVPTL